MNINKLNDLKEYQVIEERDVTDLSSKGYYLKHKKSGARILILSNADENKVFSIGFRTPPSDSTGVPHILEHSVLCGSKKFPSKDPFVELVKGSLNTFLNAMTFPDKTLYPVASCNEADFKNLMHVYMDAVFFTNIYEKEEIFRQEGWHYELNSKEDDLIYNGVVYNEMKGAFSSPEDVLEREILNSLFPDTCYANESGGNPENIPDLKFSDFLSFHSKYYHPSNSYIYLYGNMDIIERLEWMDKEYLCKYDAMEIDSEIQLQKAFVKPIEVKKKYSITSSEMEKDNTYLSYNLVIGTSLDKELYLAFQILEYALISAPGAPLKKVMLDEQIGKDIMGSYDNGTLQPIFSIIAKNSNIELKDKFVTLIKDTLKDIVKNGVNKNALKAGINYYEFRYREADFGSYPKGLMYGLQVFDSWLYDDTKPFMHIEELETFEFLKNKVNTTYFEDLIKKYLIENPHGSVVIIEAEKGLSNRMEKELHEKLQEYKASLSKEQIEELIEDTKRLLVFQETPSSKEELEAIPILRLEDIKKEAPAFYNKEVKFGDTLALHHNLYTNKIGYLTLFFDTKSVPEKLIPYMGILKSVLGYIDTKHYDYGELFNEINMNTGGIISGLSVFADVKEPTNYRAMYGIKIKFLYEKLEFAFTMIKEILFSSKLEDEKRLYEIIAQLKSRMQMSMTSAGHSTAVMRSLSYFSSSSYFSNLTSGITFYRLVERIEGDFQNEKESLISNLKEIMKYIFRVENLIVSYTGDNEGFDPLEKEVEDLKSMLYKEEIESIPYEFHLEKRNEGFQTSSKVQYVARSGDFIREGFTYTGALKVLKLILSYDYLWNNVRVKGGAYGCMSGFSRTGETYFASYRDPNLRNTNEIYENIPEYIKNFQAEDRDMLKYIIGTISDLDLPQSPNDKGERSMTAYMNHLTQEDVQRERDEILSANVDTIKKLADMIEAVLKQENICVIGNEETLKKEKDLFINLEPLFSTSGEESEWEL